MYAELLKPRKVNSYWKLISRAAEGSEGRRRDEQIRGNKDARRHQGEDDNSIKPRKCHVSLPGCVWCHSTCTA